MQRTRLRHGPLAALCIFVAAAVGGALLAGGVAAGPLDAGPRVKADRRTAAIAGKPTAPIGLRAAFSTPPAVGRPVDVTLTVAAPVGLERATLTLRAPQGVAVVAVHAPGTAPSGSASPGATALRLPDLVPGATLTVRLTLVPLAAERLYLRAGVGGEIGGRPQTRTLTLPLRLGPLPRSAAPLSRDGSGELIRSLPARPLVPAPPTAR